MHPFFASPFLILSLLLHRNLPPIPLAHFSIFSQPIILLCSVHLPFSDVPQEDEKTDKTQCIWWIYPLHMTENIFSLVLSTTSKMHMLIWLHHRSFKVPLMRDMILLWSPVWRYDSLRGLCVEKRDDCFNSVLKGREDDG